MASGNDRPRRSAVSLWADLASPAIGSPMVLHDFSADTAPAGYGHGAVVVGVDRAGVVPDIDSGDFDILLTTAPLPGRPWASVAPSEFDTALANLAARIAARPIAASLLAALLRVSETLPIAAAFQAEAMGYSTLLGGSEFQNWRHASLPKSRSKDTAPRVRVTQSGSVAIVTLTRADRRNAFDAAMRDALCEALRGLAESGNMPITLRAEGPDFCAGGDLDEFGTQTDSALAYAVRMTRYPALILAELGERVRVELHGACIGAGIEIPAAAPEIVARTDTWFLLPEVSMGLLPGAGGTVTIPRRIGRHRTAYLGIGHVRLDAGKALDWGLIDRIST